MVSCMKPKGVIGPQSDLDLPDVAMTVSKPFEDDDVLSLAFLAEKNGYDPANLDFEI